MSLRTKFTIYISLLVLFVILFVSTSVFLTQRTLLHDQMLESRKKIFKDFVYTCTEALVVKDEIQVFNTIKSVIKTHTPAIVYAGYVSPVGTVLFISRDPDQEENLRPRIFKVSRPSEDPFISPINEQVTEYSWPFFLNGEYRGTVKMGFSQSWLSTQVDEGLQVVKKRLFNAAIVILLAGILLANLLAFYLNQPIRALARAADQIGEGNLDCQVTINRNDELGKLGTTFNQMARNLKELDELKDGFVSSVSHELRSPLAAIDGYCDYLIDGLSRNLPPEKQEKSLKIIKDATIRLTNFINNILDLAKIKAGKFEIRRMPVSIYELANEIVSLFESLAANQKKTLTHDVAPDLPNVDVDPEKVKQVITNLIGNAMKFTPEGAAIRVSAYVPEVVEGMAPAFIEVWVADTGVGIPPEALGKVFDKFYQVKESEMKKPKGTGLGLAIVAEIIKLHGGRIWVESTLGKGSTFKFTLPVWQGAKNPEH